MTIAALSAVLVLLIGAVARPQPRARRIDGAAGARHRRVRSLPRRRRGFARRRRAAPDPVELAAWCDALARALRGGASLRTALLGATAPQGVGGFLEPAALALERGASLRVALDVVDDTPAHVDLVLVVLRACAEHGGPSAEPLDRAAAALRQRAAVLAERRSQSAQAHLSAVVMTLLPIGLLAVLVLTSGSVRRAITTPLGTTVLACGAIANGTGWWWMHRLIAGGAPWR